MTASIDVPESFPDPGAVQGKRVVITGAGRGLGCLLAHAFSRAGACVALVARTEKDLEAVAGELPGPSLVLSGDVTDEAFNEAVADAAVAAWGGLDVWIANAGISPIVAGPRATGASVWRRVLEVNLTGAFLGARAAARNDPVLSAAITGHTAQRRWGAPDDLAGAYQFLASDAAAFVTGTVLSVDGGYLLS